MTTTTSFLRKGALAYIGLYGTAFDRAQTRFVQLQTARKRLVNSVAAQGENIEGFAGTRFKTASTLFTKTYACGMARTRKLLPNSARSQITHLEAEIAELNDILAGLKGKEKSTKAKTVKTKTVKTAAIPADKYAKYLDGVRKYDAKASADIVRKIVNHCGISLASRDGKFVACTDEAERNTVRDSWLKKKLGLKGTDATLDTKVLGVCETMKKDRLKSRVTFYYLLAKAEGKLTAL